SRTRARAIVPRKVEARLRVDADLQQLILQILHDCIVDARAVHVAVFEEVAEVFKVLPGY
ncbi:MAG: hypothetical protein ACP5LW_04420, partial [Nitrososphaeria archaeon]